MLAMERFEHVKVLGRGAFGVALLVRDRNAGGGRRGGLRVLKEIDLACLSLKARKEARAEASVLQALSHTNVVAYVDYFLEGTKLCIVMEFADGGDLADMVKKHRADESRFDQIEALAIFVQCSLALRHIHRKHVLHRDLKCQNIFLMKSGVVKLGDFGIAKVLDHTAAQAETMIGTPKYLSPEVCDSRPYGIKADIWALGVVLYEMLALELPFQGKCLASLVVEIVTSKPKPLPRHYSSEVGALVALCLRKKPEERPSADDLLAQPASRSAWSFLPPSVLEGAPSLTPRLSRDGDGIELARQWRMTGDAATEPQHVSMPRARRSGLNGQSVGPVAALGAAACGMDDLLRDPELGVSRASRPLRQETPLAEPALLSAADYQNDRELTDCSRSMAAVEAQASSHRVCRGEQASVDCPGSARELARDESRRADEQRMEALNQAAAHAILERKLAQQQRRRKSTLSEVQNCSFSEDAVRLKSAAAKEERRRCHEAELEEARQAVRDAQREMRARHVALPSTRISSHGLELSRGSAPDSARKASVRTPTALAGGLLAKVAPSTAAFALAAPTAALATTNNVALAAAEACSPVLEATLTPADVLAAATAAAPLPPLPRSSLASSRAGSAVVSRASSRGRSPHGAGRGQLSCAPAAAACSPPQEVPSSADVLSNHKSADLGASTPRRPSRGELLGCEVEEDVGDLQSDAWQMGISTVDDGDTLQYSLSNLWSTPPPPAASK